MPSTEAELRVAVGVLRDREGRVLLARRHPDSHQGGLWEFPGGKLEAGETLAEALYRELAEELGIAVRQHRPLILIRHDYGDRKVCLDVHEVLRFDGEPQSREGQPLSWVSLDALHSYPLPQANGPIVARLIEVAGT